MYITEFQNFIEYINQIKNYDLYKYFNNKNTGYLIFINLELDKIIFLPSTHTHARARVNITIHINFNLFGMQSKTSKNQ